MKEDEINEFLKEIFNKKITQSYSGGSSYQVDIINKDGRAIIEAAFRNLLLDNRDEKIGILQAKVFTYERIISNSNFAPMVLPDEPLTPPQRMGDKEG